MRIRVGRLEMFDISETPRGATILTDNGLIKERATQHEKLFSRKSRNVFMQLCRRGLNGLQVLNGVDFAKPSSATCRLLR